MKQIFANNYTYTAKIYNEIYDHTLTRTMTNSKNDSNFQRLL